MIYIVLSIRRETFNMNTILPSYFVFSRANSIYQKPLTNRWDSDILIIILYCMVIVLILGILCWDCFSKKSSTLTRFLVIFFIVEIIVIVPSLINLDKCAKQKQDYNTWGFKVTNTNFIALPAKPTPARTRSFGNLGVNPCNNITAVTKNQVDPFKKVKRTKYELYVNANCTEVSPDKTDSDSMLLANAYCLGTMDHGKFKPEKSEIGATFANYQKYIKQHHLENHFKQKMIFINSNKYLTNDYQASLVLIGDNDYALHLSGTKKMIAKTDSNKIVAN